MSNRFRSFQLFILILTLAALAPAQWSTDPAINTPVCTAVNGQYYPEIYTPGTGGSILVWHDFRPGLQADLYVQKFDTGGTPQWTPNGVALSMAAGHQWGQTITGDGLGGAIVAWHDERNNSDYFDIFARRIDVSGTPLWTTDGIPISTAASHDEWPCVTSDGAGGAFVAWGGTNASVQRIDAAGTVQWVADGVSVASGSGKYENRWPKLLKDDSDGVFVVWQHASLATGWDIYVQRLSGSGSALWTPGGVPIAFASDFQEKPSIVSDGAGGAVIAWEDHRSGSWDMYAQRIDSSGVALWAAGGVAVCTAAGDQQTPFTGTHGTVSVVVVDGAGGAIITWQDWRSGSSSVYAQRITGLGVPQWAADGVLVSPVGGQQNPTIASDNEGGAIITWERDGTGNGIDIFAQKVDGSGTRIWGDNGAPVSTAPFDQVRPRITTDESGEAIVTWYDMRTGSDVDADIYMQKVSAAAESAPLPNSPVLTSVIDVPHDQGGAVTLIWTASHLDTNTAILPFYSIWRSISESPTAALPVYPGPVITPTFTGTAKRITAINGEEYAWEWIANQPAHRFSNYSYTAPTLFDSMSTTSGTHYFLVSAHTDDSDVFFDSNVRSGYSVDNLSPIPPSGLMATIEPGPQVKLIWDLPTDPDVESYRVYRSISSGFTPEEANKIGIADATNYTDTSPVEGVANYYRIISVDIHENESAPSGEAEASTTTNEEEVNTRVPDAYSLEQNYPNPFNPVTTIRFAIPARGVVILSVFNTLGQEVARLVNGLQEPGFRTLSFDGGALPNGVYYYILTAANFFDMKKMVLMK